MSKLLMLLPVMALTFAAAAERSPKEILTDPTGQAGG